MKTTAWFPAYTKPVRVGLYQRDLFGTHVFSYWDGVDWSLGVTSLLEAEQRPKGCAYSPYKDLKWRGCAKYLPSPVQAA